MNRFLIKILILFFLITNQSIAQENIMILKLKDGNVKIELFPDVAPNHVKRIKELADNGKYDNVVFHRVIDGFMAQTGDVKFGNSEPPVPAIERLKSALFEFPNLTSPV